LRGRRAEALKWLELLERFSPELVGGVAEGWATEHSELRIDLLAASDKEVAFFLLQSGVAYVAAGNSTDSGNELVATMADSVARLCIRSGRVRPGGERLGLAALRMRVAEDAQAANQAATSRAK
jgi:hypothetical protein